MFFLISVTCRKYYEDWREDGMSVLQVVLVVKQPKCLHVAIISYVPNDILRNNFTFQLLQTFRSYSEDISAVVTTIIYIYIYTYITNPTIFPH